MGEVAVGDPSREPIVDPGASCEAAPEPFERRRRLCLRCEKPLSGRQVRFCSGAHRTAFYHSLRHLTGVPSAPRKDRRPLRVQILGLLSDGRWYTVMELAALLAVLPMTADRKLRDLRRAEYGGFTLARRRRTQGRVSEYRLVLRED